MKKTTEKKQKSDEFHDRLLSSIASCDRDSSVPLYCQIETCVEEWIFMCPAGTRFPTDRKIATKTGVNSRTLAKALNKFIENGSLERNVKGTFIAQKRQEPTFEDHFANIHPFNKLAHYEIDSGKTIRFANYENLPAQKRCWEEIVEKFNKTQKKLRLEIVSVPDVIATSELYSAFIEKEDIDIAMIPSQLYSEFINNGHLAKLPKSLRYRIDDPSYLTSQIEKPDNYSNYAVPVHFSLSGVAFNSQFVPNLNLSDTLNAESFVAFLIEAAQENTTVDLCAFCWNLMLLFGLPSGVLTVKKAEKILKERFLTLRKLHPIHKRLNFQGDTKESIPRFLNGKSLTYIGSIGLVAQNNIENKFEMRPLRVNNDLRMSCGGTFAGVSHSSNMKTEAFTILDYLSSTEAQNIVGKHGINCACHENSNKNFKGIKAELLGDIVSSLSMTSTTGIWYWALCYKLYPIVKDQIINGDGDIKQAVSLPLDALKTKYPQLFDEA